MDVRLAKQVQCPKLLQQDMNHCSTFKRKMCLIKAVFGYVNSKQQKKDKHLEADVKVSCQILILP